MAKNMWLLFPEGLYLFGEGGIVRVEEVDDWKDGIKVAVGVALHSNVKHVTTIKSTLKDIQALLCSESIGELK